MPWMGVALLIALAQAAHALPRPGPGAAVAQDARMPGDATLSGAPACPRVRFAGEVRHGEAFAHPVGRALEFRLRPERDPATPGWTLEVRPRRAADPGEDLLWPATPPYRFWNPRYLGVSYGYTAAESVQVAERGFRFFATEADRRAAVERLDVLLWPAGRAPGEIEAAGARLAALPAYAGQLRILDARTTPATPGGPGRIEWLRFEVELCLPP
jgi:hypothetical protein